MLLEDKDKVVKKIYGNFAFGKEFMTYERRVDYIIKFFIGKGIDIKNEIFLFRLQEILDSADPRIKVIVHLLDVLILLTGKVQEKTIKAEKQLLQRALNTYYGKSNYSTSTKERMKLYRETHKERLRALAKEYRKKNKLKLNLRSIAYYNANKEKWKEKYMTAEQKEKQRIYKLTHKEQIRAYNKKYKETHRLEIKAAKAKYYQAHKKQKS